MNGLEKEFPFCSNPDCVLYVRAGDPGVVGAGNWAELPDGRMVGRSIYGGVYLCDPCGREWQPVLAIACGGVGHHHGADELLEAASLIFCATNLQ